MIKWLKSLFKKNEPEEVVVHFELPNGNKLEVTAIKPPFDYKKQLLCKDHQNYSGTTSPTNNCNACWEIYAQKLKH
jgi:hypothetical protein